MYYSHVKIVIRTNDVLIHPDLHQDIGLFLLVVVVDITVDIKIHRLEYLGTRVLYDCEQTLWEYVLAKQSIGTVGFVI